MYKMRHTLTFNNEDVNKNFLQKKKKQIYIDKIEIKKVVLSN